MRRAWARFRLDCRGMERRKRRKAFNTPHHAHALNFSVYRGRPHLTLAGAAEAFLRTVDAASGEFGFEVWAYVVMPEHVHLVIHPVEEVYDMAAIQYALKKRSAQAIFSLHPRLREECRVPRKGRTDEFRFWQAGGWVRPEPLHGAGDLGGDPVRPQQSGAAGAVRDVPGLGLEQRAGLPGGAGRDAVPGGPLRLVLGRMTNRKGGGWHG